MKLVRGFAIVSAIFILVVLAALGAFILHVSTGQQIGAALDVQGVRAYQAARAGIEWGVYEVQRSYNFGRSAVDGSDADPNTRTCPASPVSFLAGAAATSLADFTITVTCSVSAPTAGEPIVFTVQSTACNQPLGVEPKCPNTTAPGPLYVERRMSVTF
jgi:MSHA biogenesis protein MshP